MALRTSPLVLYPLDERALPAVLVPFGEEDGVIVIRGDQKTDTIVVTDTGTGDAGAVKVDIDGELFESTAAVTRIEVWSRGGADDVTYKLNGDLTTERTVEVHLGNHHDEFTAVLDGSVGEGGSLTLNVNGGNGHDHLTLDADGFNVDAGGSLTVGFKGGNGKDVLDLTFVGLLDGTASFVANGGNGKDEVTGNFDLASTPPAEEGGEETPSSGTLSIEFLGGNGVDTMSLTVENTDGLADLDAVLKGGNGKDVLSATGDVTIEDTQKTK